MLACFCFILYYLVMCILHFNTWLYSMLCCSHCLNFSYYNYTSISPNYLVIHYANSYVIIDKIWYWNVCRTSYIWNCLMTLYFSARYRSKSCWPRQHFNDNDNMLFYHNIHMYYNKSTIVYKANYEWGLEITIKKIKLSLS